MSTEVLNRMTAHEIAELLELTGWSQTKLAAELDLSQAAVQRWIAQSRVPRGPANIVLRQLLDAARKEHGQKNGKKRKPASVA